jgi:hypothetical protein
MTRKNIGRAYIPDHPGLRPVVVESTFQTEQVDLWYSGYGTTEEEAMRDLQKVTKSLIVTLELDYEDRKDWTAPGTDESNKGAEVCENES